MASIKEIKRSNGKIRWRVYFEKEGVITQKNFNSFEEACYYFYLIEKKRLQKITTTQFFKIKTYTVLKLIYFYLGAQWEKVTLRKLSESTFRRVERDLCSINEKLLLTPVGEVSEIKVRNSIRTGCFVWLRAAFELLKCHEIFIRNPCPKPLKRKNNKPIPPSHADVQRLFYATEDCYIKMFLFLCAVCGLRTGEALGLKREDIKGDSLHIRRHLTPIGIIEGTKRGGNREITVPVEFFTLLSTLNPKSNFIIHGKNINQPVNYQSFRTHKTRPLYVSLGLDFSNHALRHFAAANWLEEGRNIKEIQLLLGHAHEAETLRHYGHLLNKPNAVKTRFQI
ncbi:MAG TPA: tyrosine-type recombinase/integrase [Arsenophonus nasoniae]|uniref:tyrosine-type recombinase/integrase n=1 Tax=Arsenophonus nasoniae TaxID=638 RepID=UPI00387A148D